MAQNEGVSGGSEGRTDGRTDAGLRPTEQTLGIESSCSNDLGECGPVGFGRRLEVFADRGEGAECAGGQARFEEGDCLVQESEVVLDVCVHAGQQQEGRAYGDEGRETCSS